MKMTPAKIVLFFCMILVLMNPPAILGLLGPDGRRMGYIIEDGLGTDAVRIAVFGRR